MKVFKVLVNKRSVEEMTIQGKTKKEVWKKAKSDLTLQGVKGTIKSIKEVKEEVAPEPAPQV